MLGGGLLRGRLHEIYADDSEHAASAAGFSLLLAMRAALPGQPLLWVREDRAQRKGGVVHAPGLTDLGCDPGRCFFVTAPDPVALLRVGIDAMRCAAFGAVIIEAWGRMTELDLIASRRFALAAKKSGVTALLLRCDATPVPSAADTRWGVAAEISFPPGANAPGKPVFAIELLRRRAGPAGMRWQLEWNRDRSVFDEAALSGAVVSVPVGRSPADSTASPLRRIA